MTASRIALAALVALGLVFRLAVVAEFHAAAGDGVGYYQLSQELWRHHRLAYSATEAPSVARLPAYPLLLALVVHEAPVTLEKHLVRATRAQAVLDVGSALLLFFILAERGFGKVARWLALVLVVTCPLMILLSSYGLTESFATFVALLALWTALRGMRTRPTFHAALAGVALGVGLLIRIDGVLMAAPVALAIVWSPGALRLRAGRLALCGAIAMAMFTPWLVRSTYLLGKIDFAATAFCTVDGKPMPTGILRWMLTWGSRGPAEELTMVRVAFQRSLDRSEIYPQMVDSEAERARVDKLYAQYRDEWLSPEVDAGFRALADERAARHPLRTYLTLPLKRWVALFSPAPEYDFPMRSRLLHLPAWRFLFGWWDRAVFALALVGALVLLRRRDGRRTVALIVAAVATRSLFYIYTHPYPVQRYVVELFPLVIALATVGPEVLTARAVSCLRGIRGLRGLSGVSGFRGVSGRRGFPFKRAV